MYEMDYEHELELFENYDEDVINFADGTGDNGDYLYVCKSDIDEAVKYGIGCPDSDMDAYLHESNMLRRWLTDPDYYGCDVMDVSQNLVERQKSGEHITCDDVREALYNLVDKVVLLANTMDAWHDERALCVA